MEPNHVKVAHTGVQLSRSLAAAGMTGSGGSAVSDLHGSYNDPNEDYAGTTSFASLTGATMTLRPQFIFEDTWANLKSDFDFILGSIAPSPYQPAMSILMIPTSETLASNASNTSTAVTNHTYFADQLQSQKPNSIVRLGWELNIGTSGPGQIQNDPSGFVTLWNTIAPIYRSAGIKIDFNTVPNAGYDFTGPLASIHTNLDYISTDPYSQYYGTLPDSSTSPNNLPTYSQFIFDAITNASFDGLTAIHGYNVTYGKQMNFPEWGGGNKNDGHSTGDDPLYVNNIAAWIEAHGDVFLYDSWFNGTSGIGWDTTLSDFPNMLAAYQSNFG